MLDHFAAGSAEDQRTNILDGLSQGTKKGARAMIAWRCSVRFMR